MNLPALTLACLAFALSEISAAEPSAAAKDENAAKQKVLARLEFNPGGGPWEGETPFEGASWTALGPMFGDTKDLSMQAHAGLGDRFPVTDPMGKNLFQVMLENGIDEHVVLLVTSAEGVQKVRLPRDKKVEITVEGAKYRLSFPTTRVEAKPGARPSTNKAMIVVTQVR